MKGIHEIKSGIYKGLTTKECLDAAWPVSEHEQKLIASTYDKTSSSMDIIQFEEIEGQLSDGYWENEPECKHRILDLIDKRPKEDYMLGMFGRMILYVRSRPEYTDYGVGNLFKDIIAFSKIHNSGRLEEYPTADNKDCRKGCPEYIHGECEDTLK
jgi:hypothetical protein